ncbi:MAG: hypothetical protein KatS3mg129_0142 [Leptospiraceae bacterium]|nr:MAG: hypothetical protein KatS3mg129_0142 [Leptospiraceae bacterium]
MNDYPKNTLELDNLLRKLLQDPFLYIFDFNSEKNISTTVSSTPLVQTTEEDISEILYSEEKRILSQFLRPIEILLRPHITISQEILNRLYQAQKDPKIKDIIEQYGSDLIEKLENVRKFYRIFIESNTNTALEIEASKLVKRFFGENYKENHKNFIKMKRYIERLKSFYEQVSKLWKDIEGLIDTFLYINETKHIVEILKQKLADISLLNHQTDIFLKFLIKQLNISEFQYNPSNFTYTANITYNDNIDYTLEGLYESLKILSQPQIITEKKESISFQKATETIIIESELKKFYRNVIFTKIIGSKDWNRTKDYYLELNREDYQKDLDKFYQSVHVIYDQKTFEESFQVFASRRTPLNKDQLDEIFQYYLNMLQDIFNENYHAIIHKDFAGIEKPTIFFYHIGANTFYNIIVEDLRDKRLGEIMYNQNQVLIREFPYNIIKKLLIDWWNDLTSLLDIEDVDSYWIYSIHQEIVLNEYLKDFEFIQKEIKKNQISMYQFDEWFRQHYKELIGIRKFYIYKRFYPTLLVDLKTKAQ